MSRRNPLMTQMLVTSEPRNRHYQVTALGVLRLAITNFGANLASWLGWRDTMCEVMTAEIPPPDQPASPDDLRASYGAIVDYHNNLVQMRFNVAGLFLAANAFLASGFFQTGASSLPWFALPVLGILLAGICWLLELRTYQLLDNLADRGVHIERLLGISTAHGFFALMRSQAIGPRLLITRLRIPPIKSVRYIVSHSFGIGLLYGVVAAFWTIAILLHP